MNRRSFLFRISAVAAAAAVPSAVKAATSAPVPATPLDQDHLRRLGDAMNEIHRQQSAGPSFVGMPLDQFVKEVKGDFPIEHRSTRVDKGYTLVEFDVMAPCLYVPPSWLNLSMPAPRHLFPGDILSIAVNALRVCPTEIEGSS